MKVGDLIHDYTEDDEYSDLGLILNLKYVDEDLGYRIDYWVLEEI